MANPAFGGRSPGVAIALLSLALSAACSQGSASSGAPRAEIYVTGSDPIVALHGDMDAPDIAIEGKVGYDAGSKCLTFTVGDQVFTPIWPEGVEPVVRPDGKRGVTVPGAGTIADGDWLNGGGQTWETGDEVTNRVPAAVSGACRARDGFAVLNAGDIAKGRVEDD